MQLIRGIHNLASHKQDLEKGCVLTIGNFDGVHLGHQQILKQLNKHAIAMNLPSVVMLFEPLPIEYFSAKKAPVRLMNLREKINAFNQNNLVNKILLCKFNQQFAQQTAMEFVQELLVKQLNVKKLIIGDDFRFAKNREGDFNFLQQQGKKLGMQVEKQATFEIDGARVSSTRIRQCLANNNLSAANFLLNDCFSFNGRVIHGKKLGRQLGFRTLNLNPKRNKMPINGVYSVYVSGLAKENIAGIANIGIRPTVNGVQPAIEVHLFNWQKDVYGAHVGVHLHKFIRNEQKFSNLDDLKKQIKLDVKQAKYNLNIND